MGSNKKQPKVFSHVLLRKCFNKYFLATLFFLVWVLFFDKHNIFTQQKIRNSVAHLEQEKLDFQHQLEAAKLEREDIDQNEEKYAREKYLMHKDNEEVFIIEHK